MKNDVLNRDNDVNQIFNIIEKYSESREYISFGLDGEQGVGKTFVVEKLNEKLKEAKENNEPKYFVINYNCWENDYYNDPLNGILISINNTIEESKDKFDETFNKVLIEVAKDLSKLVVSGLLSFNPIIGKAINYGFDVKERVKKQDEIVESIDDNINLKKVLSRVKDNIKKISDVKTIVIIIDELDRCLPEYQIKVLERLHHIFNDMSNVIQIPVFDKKLIENTIFSIFGKNISIDRYLDKFISFSLNVDCGQCQEIILNEYPELFIIKNMTQRDKGFIKDLIKSSNVNIRSIKKVLSNIKLINEVLNIDFFHQNYISIIEFEIIIILLRLNVKELKRVTDGFVAREKDILAYIMGISGIFSGFVYNEYFAKTIKESFCRINEYLDDNKIVTVFNDNCNNNILLCKVIISLICNQNLYRGAVRLECDTLDICKDIIKYIDMLYPDYQ